ncbi:MAG: glycosyltransferase [Deltaproteobacteria bacterium]|nr:glycosyltransferase [Deltaproteobacteria bacterium]
MSKRDEVKILRVQSEQSPLVVHTDGSRAWGGQEIRTLTELREMRRLGFRVALIVPADSELARRGKAEDFPVHAISSFGKFDLRSWLELFRIITAIRPTVLNTHSSEDSWMAGAVARLFRVPLVIRTRHVLAPISSALSYNLFPHVIFTCGATIAERVVSQGVQSDKIVVLPTGNDENRFRFSMENREKVRSMYGIGEKDILVGNIGFLRRLKGHPYILKTAAAMPENYRFMFVGDGEERPALQAMAHELGIENRVIFTGHQERPEDFLSALDICFFSSHIEEGVSQALVQGLLNGLPVLACRIPSTMEPLSLIEDYRLVDYDDVPAACQGLAELVSLPLRDPQRMTRQHQVIAHRYGLQRMVKILVDTYDQYGVRCLS